ncbi:MAG: hypothetical protein QM751_14945 [Paludibacteraceae bacterium]
MSETRKIEILDFTQNHAICSSGEIHKEFITSISYVTVKLVVFSGIDDILLFEEHITKNLPQGAVSIIMPI